MLARRLLSVVACLLYHFLITNASPWITRGTVHPSTTPKPIAVVKERIVEQSDNLTVHEHRNTTILCRASTKVNTCGWLWEFPKRDGRPTVVAGFPGHGEGGSDCSLNLVNVSHIQEGWWTCRAQTGNSSIIDSRPVFLHVFTSPVITFEVKPVNRTFSIGGIAELECKPAITVQSCQWSFQQQGQTEPLVVTEGAPKGSRDCSLTLQQVSYEQVGVWRCGARVDDSDSFTYTDTAYIQVEHKEEAFPVEFTQEPMDTEMVIGSTGQLHCKVREEAHIEDCRWYWQPLGRSHSWRVLMREFPPVYNDCSIEFTNVSADPEGLWSCHVKPIHSDKFKASKSAKLTVRGEVAVSTLNREISVSEGEPLRIQCVAEEPVKTCQWKRKELFKVDVTTGSPWVVSKTFQPGGNESRDCSLRLEHAKMEDQGLWLCSMQHLEDQPFHATMPTAVIVKTPSKVRFAETYRSRLAAVNSSLTLNCSTHSAVSECLWMWYEDESKVSERVLKFNFTPTTSPEDRHDCRLVIPRVERGLQGIWQCGVKHGDPSHPNITYARPFSLTVINTGMITFKEVPRRVYIVPGSLHTLMCLTREPVEECIWEFRANFTSEVREMARFEPLNFNNCSLRVIGMVDTGLWTCGAREPGHHEFTMSEPVKLDYIYPDNITTSSTVKYSEGELELLCKMPGDTHGLSCDWMHPLGYNVSEVNDTERYRIENRPDSGSCSLIFRPLLVDIGHWTCQFSTDSGHQILAQASFTVLGSPQNVRLSWLVGVLATSTMILSILLFAVITCRVSHCGSRNMGTVQLNKPEPSLETKQRYSEDPTKGINFSFTESPELLVDFTAPPPPLPETHHYERVGRFLTHRPSFYQNVH